MRHLVHVDRFQVWRERSEVRFLCLDWSASGKHRFHRAFDVLGTNGIFPRRPIPYGVLRKYRNVVVLILSLRSVPDVLYECADGGNTLIRIRARFLTATSRAL